MGSEGDWALLRSGRLDEELLEVREVGEKITLFAQLRYIALEEGRKMGWAAHLFRSLHGHWPAREWEKVPPMRPTETVYGIVQHRQRGFRRSMREFYAERRANDEREGGGVEDSEIADAVCEGAEGAIELPGGGRVPGVEEQDVSPGELCEADE